MITGDEPMYPKEVPEFEYQGQKSKEKTVIGGITIREHFAAMAMQGICANQRLNSKNEGIVKAAVSIADALIAELNKPKE